MENRRLIKAAEKAAARGVVAFAVYHDPDELFQLGVLPLKGANILLKSGNIHGMATAYVHCSSMDEAEELLEYLDKNRLN